MVSPARRHFIRESARLQNQAAAEANLENLPIYQRLLLSLQKDKAALKLIESIQDKARAKAEMLPQYAEWMKGVTETAHPSQDDEIFTTCLLWMIDTGALDEAVLLAEFAIDKRMQTGDDYQRTLPTLLIEQIAEQITAGHTISESHLDRLIKIVLDKNGNGTHAVDMPDEVRAKFLKAAGLWHQEFGSKDRAADLYERALSYNEKVGVKRLLKAITAGK